MKLNEAKDLAIQLMTKHGIVQQPQFNLPPQQLQLLHFILCFRVQLLAYPDPNLVAAVVLQIQCFNQLLFGFLNHVHTQLAKVLQIFSQLINHRCPNLERVIRAAVDAVADCFAGFG